MKFQTTDPDHLSSVFSAPDRRLEFRPIDKSRRISAETFMTQIGRLTLWEGDTQSGFTVTSRSDNHDFRILMPGSGTAAIRGGNKELAATPKLGALYRLRSGSSVEYSPHSGSLWVGVSSSHLIQTLSEALDSPVQDSSAIEDAFRTADQGLVKLKSIAQAALNLERDGHSLSTSKFAVASLERTMLGLVIDSFFRDIIEQKALHTPKICPRQVRRVLDYIEANPAADLSIADLAKIAGVSPRALQYSFRSFVGCSPMKYLLRVRLARAKAELTNPETQISIAEVARKWGFLSPSRFSALTKEAFGETPRQLRHRRS